MQNKLLEQHFIDSACLSQPLPAQWDGLPAAALPKRLLQKVLNFLLLFAGLWLLSQTVRLSLPWDWLAGGLLLLLVLQLALLPLQVRRYRYLLRQLDVLQQQGLFWRSAVLIPLCRVQHVTLAQGPLQKLFGLATLRVYSAGGGAAEMRLADISHAQAKLLSELLSQLIPTDSSGVVPATTQLTATTQPEPETAVGNRGGADGN